MSRTLPDTQTAIVPRLGFVQPLNGVRALAVVAVMGTHTDLMGFSGNAVQLDPLDGRNGWPGGLRPVGVSGAFDVPLGHLAFDEAWAGSESPDRVETPTQQDDGVSPAVVSARRGENRAPVRASGE